MKIEDAANQGAAPMRLMHSLKGLAGTALGILQTRLELLVSEVEEERLRILQLLLWGSAALLFFAFALLMLTFAVVVLFWETHRLLAALLLCVVYLAIAGAFAAVARRRIQRPRLFAASMAELAKDRDTLKSM